MAQLRNSVAVMRAELRNLRKQVEQLRRILKSETQSINGRIESVSQEKSPQVPLVTATPTPYPSSRASLVSRLSEAAIGTIKTCFREKNGTPRQPGLVRSARGEIRIDSCKSFTNPSHSLEGLEEFSHAWLLFVFHLNEQDSVKAKVRPPRMGGEKRGVFATRSPHRPCPLGLSLVRIERVTGDTVYVSGVDLVDGTPVLDIKPYIPTYDNPAGHQLESLREEECGGESNQCRSLVRVAPWLESLSTSSLEVEFTREAESQLSLFQCRDKVENHQESSRESNLCWTPEFVLDTFSSLSDAREAIVGVLKEDPRSVYRKNKCSEELYKFSIDNLNITCQFTEEKAIVVDIQPKERWTYNKQHSR